MSDMFLNHLTLFLNENSRMETFYLDFHKIMHTITKNKISKTIRSL